MLLSDKRIMEELENGNIIIEPFHREQLGTNSYDVRLGNWYYEQSTFATSYDIDDEISIKEFWSGPYDAGGSIEIVPGQTILAHTNETIGGRNGITTSIRARSSTGRSCLSIAKDAGLGDVGYISRWTLEISNHSTIPIFIPVGIRIGQMMFYEVGETLKNYTGKYGSWHDWKPEDMLPKLYKDYDAGRYKEYLE